MNEMIFQGSFFFLIFPKRFSYFSAFLIFLCTSHLLPIKMGSEKEKEENTIQALFMSQNSY